MASVLVTDGEQRAALAVVRSLGRAGHNVHVCSSRRNSIAGASRFCESHHQVADPLSSSANFANSIRDISRQQHCDLILPIAEASVLAVLPERESMPAAIPFPSFDAFKRICDKEEITRVARDIGIGVPEQVVIKQPGPANASEGIGLGFPLVLKPARSVVSSNGARSKTSVIHVNSATQLDSALASVPRAAYPVLVQRRIVGPGVGVFLLIWKGNVLAAFAHRRIREKPPSGGVSVLRESIPLDAELLRQSVSLLQAFQWQGAAMIEYKVDAKSGRAYVMEVNGRFWGSLQLAIDAGLDFPELLVRAALGRQVKPTTSYRTGVQTRWFFGDVDYLVARLKSSKSDLSLPADAEGRLSALANFFKSFHPGIRSEILRLSDLRPALLEAFDWVRRK